MKIKLLQNNETYAVRDIVRLFAPMQTYEFVSDGDYDILAAYENGKYHSEVRLDGKTFSHTLTFDGFDKNKLKFCLFKALSKAYGQKPPWGILTGIRPTKLIREMMDKNFSDGKIADILKTDFLADDDKINLAVMCAERERRIIKKIPKNSVSLYISIPFCPTRCHYCSFISQSVAFSKNLVVPYLEKLEYEMKKCAVLLKEYNKTVDSVYIGGGTPTTLSACQLEKLINTLFEEFDLSKMREFTVEAGRPDTIDKEKLSVLKKCGVGRISINPQTFNGKTLEIIGRSHTAKETEEKFYLARSMEFSHINTDIIAGLYGENIYDFEKTMEKIIFLNPESVTVHTLCVKRGAYLAEKYDYFNRSNTSQASKMLSFAAKTLTENKKFPYYMYRQKNMAENLENTGFCSEGCECIYNVAIMQEVQTNIALGAGASTKLVCKDRIERSFNVKEVSEYIKRTDEMVQRKISLFENNI